MKSATRSLLLIPISCIALVAVVRPTLRVRAADTSITYAAKQGPGGGRHVVLLAGDEEYRSEESLPMLAKILSERHGFKTTVVFSIDPDGTVNPNNGASLSDGSPIESADAIVMALRFRKWSDADMARFDRRVRNGVPIVALRTSTHAFNGFPKGSAWESWNYNSQGGFGRRVLGETWINHWGRHKVEGTRGVIEPAQSQHPVLSGITDVFGDSDVYEAYPTADATILIRGAVVASLSPAAPVATYRKIRSSDKQAQDINDPMMPVVWTRTLRTDAGATQRVLTSTLGAATDLLNEGLRRLVVNGVYWGLNLPVPAKADVAVVDEYQPSFYGFDGFRKGLVISDFALGKRVPGVPLAPPQPPGAGAR